MYEAPGVRALAVRKSPSMPTLEISVEGSGDVVAGKCAWGRKAPCQRKVRTAISLCVGVLLCCVVLVVLVTVDPAKSTEQPWHWGRGSREQQRVDEAALDGMGVLFRRGTRAMPHLVVAHLAESTSPEALRLFLRGLHRSGTPAHADVVLLFPVRPVPAALTAVIREEESYFQKLLAKAHAGPVHTPKLSPFYSAAYTGTPLLAKGTSVWAERTTSSGKPRQRSPLHFGAVVGFDVQELDPDDALCGFLDQSTIHLRRWVCYQMLLGMVRHRYRQVLLTEVSGVVILHDVLAAPKKDSSLHLYRTDQNSSSLMEYPYGTAALDEEERRRKVISAGVILGGMRPVRAVAASMATEIVRVALLRKSRAPFPADALLSYLVHRNSALARKLSPHLHVHDTLPGSPRARKPLDLFRSAIVQGLHLDPRRTKLLNTDICRSQTDIAIYSDCYSLPEAVIETMIQ